MNVDALWNACCFKGYAWQTQSTQGRPRFINGVLWLAGTRTRYANRGPRCCCLWDSLSDHLISLSFE